MISVTNVDSGQYKYNALIGTINPLNRYSLLNRYQPPHQIPTFSSPLFFAPSFPPSYKPSSSSFNSITNQRNFTLPKTKPQQPCLTSQPTPSSSTRTHTAVRLPTSRTSRSAPEGVTHSSPSGPHHHPSGPPSDLPHSPLQSPARTRVAQLDDRRGGESLVQRR